MRWFFAILVLALLILTALGLVGFKVVSLPTPHDPFPPQIRAQLDSLNDTRREIEWLAANARMVGEASKLPQEKQDYDALAGAANAWLKAVQQGLASDQVDIPMLTGQFEEHVKPEAKKLAATLQAKMRWMGPQRLDAGILRVATTEADHIISVLDNGWEDVRVYFKFARASGDEPRKLAMSQLDDMKWLPWTELMAEQF
jgi:hypothetical protein